LCTAAGFAKRLPNLASFYLRVSKEYMDKAGIKHHELTHDQMMRLCPEVKEDLFPERWKEKDATMKILSVGSKIGDIVCKVENELAQADMNDESSHVEAKGICSKEEWIKIVALHMDVGADTDVETYRGALREMLTPTLAQKWTKAVATASNRPG
jgi:ferritin-like metal-binding protein YciE